MSDKLLSNLKNNEFFKLREVSHLNPDEISAKIVALNEGEILFRKGDPADSLFLVVDGEMRELEPQQFSDAESISYSENSYFGYLTAEEPKTRNSTIVAVKGTYLISIAYTELDETTEEEIEEEIKTESEDSRKEEFHEEVMSPLITEDEIPDVSEMDADTDDQELLSEKFLDDTSEESIQGHEPSEENVLEKDEVDAEEIKSSPEPVTAAESLENTIRTTEQIEKINKAALLVNSNLKVGDVLKNIVNVATDLTNSERGLIFLIDKENEDIWANIEHDGDTKEIRLKLGDGIAGSVAMKGEILNIKDVSEQENFSHVYDDFTDFETVNMICVPIINKQDEVLGVLQLLNSKEGEFSKLDEEFLKGLSIHAALALENATLLERLLQSERVSSIGKMANFLIQDIKKPLLVSKRYAEHLKTKELPEGTDQILDMLLEQLNQVVDLVQATSGYSEGKTILRAVNISTNDMIQDYTERLSDYTKKMRSKVIHDFGPDSKIKIDSKEFFQCFTHIIKNACESRTEGCVITISTKLEEGFTKILFSDNGPGIPENLKENLFEPFTSHGKVESTGLGLAITKKIVEAHDGKISYESSPGNGTTIIVSLPTASTF
jgi:signal transduction histidine kinase